MSNWGSTHFSGGNPLVGVVAPMPPRLKQAIYGKMHLGDFRRGTWADCVINRASEHQVTSYRQGAQHFDVDESVIRTFIQRWDSLHQFTLREANGMLREALLQIGLFSEAGSPETRSVRERVYTSEETRMKEQFEELVSSLETTTIHDEPTQEQIQLVGDLKQANMLLASC